jgi:hypothetical protein
MSTVLLFDVYIPMSVGARPVYPLEAILGLKWNDMPWLADKCQRMIKTLYIYITAFGS